MHRQGLLELARGASKMSLELPEGAGARLQSFVDVPDDRTGTAQRRRAVSKLPTQPVLAGPKFRDVAPRSCEVPAEHGQLLAMPLHILREALRALAPAPAARCPPDSGHARPSCRNDWRFTLEPEGYEQNVLHESHARKSVAPQPSTNPMHAQHSSKIGTGNILHNLKIETSGTTSNASQHPKSTHASKLYKCLQALRARLTLETSDNSCARTFESLVLTYAPARPRRTLLPAGTDRRDGRAAPQKLFG